MRLLLPLLFASSCSLLLEGGEQAQTDAGNPTSDAAVIDVPGVDIDAPANLNTTDWTKPYDCDGDTYALYHLDTAMGTVQPDACGVVSRALDGSPLFVPNDEFGNAVVMTAATDPLQGQVSDDLVFVDAFTVEAWVQMRVPPANTGNRYFIASANDTMNTNGKRRFNVLLLDGPNGYVLRAEIADGDCGQSLNAGDRTAFTDTEMHHVAVTVTVDVAGEVTIGFFRDGVDLGSLTPGTDTGICQSHAETVVVVGGINLDSGVGREFNHVIDEVRISTVARFPLSADESIIGLGP